MNMEKIRLSLPHPIVLLLSCVLLAAVLTWIFPAGEFDRHIDSESGVSLVIAGTYHAVESSPVGLLDALIAVPRGIVDGADVMVVIFLVGGAFALLESTGALSRLVGILSRRSYKPKVVVAFVCATFSFFGAIEYMHEEIIALIPVMVLLSSRLGFGALTALSMSIGAAVVGSAFGPFNPFAAGLALRFAELPATSALGLRLALLVAAVTTWIAWTIYQTRKQNRTHGFQFHLIKKWF
jgi:uncharacterized ion transporter superfamily protein YfcC